MPALLSIHAHVTRLPVACWSALSFQARASRSGAVMPRPTIPRLFFAQHAMLRHRPGSLTALALCGWRGGAGCRRPEVRAKFGQWDAESTGIFQGGFR